MLTWAFKGVYGSKGPLIQGSLQRLDGQGIEIGDVLFMVEKGIEIQMVAVVLI